MKYKILSFLLIGAMLITFAACDKNSQSTKSKDINTSSSEMQLDVAVSSLNSAVMTVSGIDFPETFKAKYDGYSEGKLPYYCTITFGDYSVSVMYIPSLIEEYSKNEGKAEIPLSALKANAMKITGSGENARSDELQGCTVNVSAGKNSLTFDFELSNDCDIDLTKTTQYKVEIFALGDFQTKTFNIKQGGNSNITPKNPTKRDLKVTLIDERTAEFRLTDPDLEDFYQVSENLTYNWEIRFFDSKHTENQWNVYSMTPYVNSLSSIKKEDLTCGFSRNGLNVGYITNNEKQCDTEFDFKIDGKAMVWTVHYPEFFRLGENYDTEPFDFRDYDTFLVQHFKIENNNANTIYDDQYYPKDIVYDNGFTENYIIKPLPELFTDSGDGDDFKPVSSNYVIVETVVTAHHPIKVKEFALYSLTENGIVIDECHKWECNSIKDFRFLMYGENETQDPLGIQIDKNVIKTSGKTIYFKADSSSIGYPPEDVFNFRDKCDENGYYRQTNYKENEDRLIYFSKTK